MMVLISLPQTLQDLYRLLWLWFFHYNRLETSLQRRIFFDILAIFTDRSRPNQLNLTTGKCRLQNIGCIHGAFCTASTNDGMKLIDKQQHITSL